MRNVPVEIAADINDTGGRKLNPQESEELRKSSGAGEIQEGVQIAKLIAQGLDLIPDFGAHLHFWGVGPSITTGGNYFGPAASVVADALMAHAESLSRDAVQSAKIGGYARREQDWAFQRSLAAGEIQQLFKQIRAAQIREAIARIELENHRKQMEHSATMQAFLDGETTVVGNGRPFAKTSTQGFYAYMRREVKSLHNDCYGLAYEIAKKAERALQRELGDDQTAYLKPSYLTGREGLLAGEKLHFDIKRMEMAYHEQNKREYELTKHVSLLQVDPVALVNLRTTGRCTLSLPEELFDFDGPGHYFRRIKSVALSVPCVVGPYASVNCTLTLLKSSIRTKTTLLDNKYSQGVFEGFSGSLQSIVTSGAQNDTGLFETNLRDERYLPFESAGAISDWQLTLPGALARGETDPSKTVRQFNYDTIADVILHIRYTAREGGEVLRAAAMNNLVAKIRRGSTACVRLFSIRHEFPTDWAKFISPTTGDGRKNLTFTLTPEHYPFWLQGASDPDRDSSVRADLFVQGETLSDVSLSAGGTNATQLAPNQPIQGWRQGTIPAAGAALGPWSLSFNTNKNVSNIYLALTRRMAATE